MELLFLILIFLVLLGIYDLIRRVHVSLMQQRDELQAIREELRGNKTGE